MNRKYDNAQILLDAIEESKPYGTALLSTTQARRILADLRAARKAFWQMTLVAGFLAVFLVAGSVAAWKREHAVPPAAPMNFKATALELAPVPPVETRTADMLPWWHSKKVYKV